MRDNVTGLKLRGWHVNSRRGMMTSIAKGDVVVLNTVNGWLLCAASTGERIAEHGTFQRAKEHAEELIG